MKREKKGRDSYFVLKLDIQKTYDIIKWGFLRKMMRALRFSEKWINLVMECIAMVSYFIKINGQIEGNIKPSRGLRQGDPLSPYLFNICVEGLSLILHAARHANLLKGMQMIRQYPPITYSFFVDDSFVFG